MTEGQKRDEPKLIEWIIVCGFLLLFMLSFFYGDLKVTVIYSIDFIKDSLNGNLKDFYDNTINNSYGLGDPAVYDFPVYLILGIFNFPILLASYFFSINDLMGTPLVLFTMKLSLIPFLIVSAIFLYKVAVLLTDDESYSKWIVFFYITSINLIYPVVIISQYDILGVAFTLGGIYYYLKGCPIKFYIFFVIAITLKLFALFIFIPLLLLDEKRLAYIFRNIVIGCSGLLICKGVFSQNVGYQIATGFFTQEMFGKLSANTSFTVGIVPVSLFGIIYGLVCVAAYWIQCTEKKQVIDYTIYFGFAIFTSFSILCVINSYWIILCVPFAALLLTLNRNRLRVNLLLESAMSLIIYVALVYSTDYTFSTHMISPMFLPLIFGHVSNQYYHSIKELFIKLNLDMLMPMLIGCAVSCFIALMVLNRPNKSADKNATFDRKTLWGRFLLNISLPLLLIGMYFYVKPQAIIDTTAGLPRSERYNIYNGNVVEQQFSIDTVKEIHGVELSFITDNAPPLRMASVNVTIRDNTTNTLLADERIPFTEIIEGQGSYYINFEKNVIPQRHYSIVVTGLNGYPESYVSLSLNELNTEGGIHGQLMVNGCAVDGILSMRLYNE